MPLYQVGCGFYIKANNLKEAELWCKEDPDFVEKYIIIAEIDEENVEESDIYKNINP